MVSGGKSSLILKMVHKTLDDYVIERYVRVPVNEIKPDEENYRGDFTLSDVEEVARSMCVEGQIQAALLERHSRGKHKIVAGELRYHAVQMIVQRGWEGPNFLTAKVVRPLPPALRLRIQLDENDCKENVPPHRFADHLWGRYILKLAERLKDSSQVEMLYGIGKSGTFWDIPEEVRSLFSVEEYAGISGKHPSTIRKYFYYQKLNQNIKRMVESPKSGLSYSAAFELIPISEKGEQMRILKIVMETGEPTSQRIRKVVRKYKEEEGRGAFDLTLARGTKKPNLRELSRNLEETSRLVGVLESIAGLDEGIFSLDVFDEVSGKNVTPGLLLNHARNYLGEFHEQFLGEEDYRRRWEQKPKKASIAGLISRNGRKATGKEVRAMDLAKFKMIDLGKDVVRPHPHNPRGKIDEDDPQQKKLTQSVRDVGLIQDVVLMEGDKPREYISLEGHRRDISLRQAGVRRFGALVFPKGILSEREQLLIMYDSTIFEQVNSHNRAMGIARQYELEKKERGKLSVADFCRLHEVDGWSDGLVRNAIAYRSLVPEVREMARRGLITQATAVTIARTSNKTQQRELARSAAIFKQTSSDIFRKIKADSSQSYLFSKSELEGELIAAERRDLLRVTQEHLSGVYQGLERLGDLERRHFLNDYALSHKFQGVIRSLDRALGNIPKR